jgi:hypothetical protein
MAPKLNISSHQDSLLVCHKQSADRHFMVSVVPDSMSLLDIDHLRCDNEVNEKFAVGVIFKKVYLNLENIFCKCLLCDSEYLTVLDVLLLQTKMYCYKGDCIIHQGLFSLILH